MRLSQLVRHPQFIERLSCVYQPLWALRENRLWGLEALARYHDAEFGAISPGEFMPVAEEYPDAADRIGDWMLSAACRQRAAWRNLLPDEVRVSVNVSATQLRAGNLPARVARCLASASLPPSLLTVELTESAAIADFTHSHAQLRQISQSGIHVAIDDFGVGYSSLSYLAALPANGLKVDRSFISSVESSVQRIELLRGICSLGRAMTMTVVVEGVESLAMASWLPEVGCDVVQGFAISRPLAPARFADWYRAERPILAETLARNAPRPPGTSTPLDRAGMQTHA
jgi:EAL domain-containing protein (putative c-di-GMP-specific phosphodiesterase class I)